jgi:sterol desaturase/sphingolipid hydroxylase (fatty acid hydroxylase superfamily)
MNIPIFIITVAATYYLLSILQTVLHRDFGHKKRIRAIFLGHAIGHHGLYNKNNLRTDKFIDLETSALRYYGIPVFVVGAIVFSVASPLVIAAHVSGVLLTVVWHIHLHRHYHLTVTPWERFAWFREKRRLHFIHHLNARYNFAVIEFWIDDLLGTRKEA